jgi:hypothetical protein
VKFSIRWLLSALFLPLVISANAHASSILISTYNYHSASDYSDLQSSLEAAGHSVQFVDGTVSDSISDALGGGSYDQVFIFDVTTTNYMSSNDLSALSAFHNAASSMVLDTQSYNYLSWNRSDSNGISFLTNVADEFANYGGGIYLGADHGTTWAMNTNAVLSAFGMDTVTDSISSEITSYDASSPLFDGVDPTSWGNSSYGTAISGMQNGQLFDVLASDGTNALISASFVSASAVPVPAAVWLFGSGLLGLLGFSRQKKAMVAG